MLDTDVSFLLTRIVVPDPQRKNYHPNLPPSKKIRLQISPDSCVKELNSILMGRVQFAPFSLHGLVAKTRKGYELGPDDPVGEVAERGDSLSAWGAPVCTTLPYSTTQLTHTACSPPHPLVTVLCAVSAAVEMYLTHPPQPPEEGCCTIA